MNRDDIIVRLEGNRARLESLGVRRMFLFGSFARAAEVASSDIDLMVDLDEGPAGRKPLFSAFDVGGIQFALTEILGRKVDLVVRNDALKPDARLRAVAESQLVDVF
ncbi:MAG TPA: nucleotidyltransferase domain-containing protein [Caulobacteraceae bacterium]